MLLSLSQQIISPNMILYIIHKSVLQNFGSGLQFAPTRVVYFLEADCYSQKNAPLIFSSTGKILGC